jgi:hypothetical protein
MRATDIDPTYMDNGEDHIQQRKPSFSRKPIITLINLNKLKKMRAAKDLDILMRNDFLEIMYAVPSEEGGGL